MTLRRLLLGGLSHGVALLAGWALWTSLGPVREIRTVAAGRSQSGEAPRKAATRDLTGTAGEGSGSMPAVTAGEMVDRLAAAEVTHFTSEDVLLDDLCREFQRVDWAYLFGRGEVSAQEVMAAVRKASPELAAAGSDELRAGVFDRLAAADPRRAAELLPAGISTEERARCYLVAGRGGGDMMPMDQIRQLLDQAPAEQAELRSLRTEFWESETTGNLAIQAEGWIGQVESLPPGLDRDLALGAACVRLSRYDPVRAERVRQEIVDPRVRAESGGAP